jgi:ATP-dependent RNA helicase SUPV3L1/SUV3
MTALGDDAKSVLTAARRALRSEIARRITLIEQCPDDSLTLTDAGEIAWDGAPVARLAAGGSRLKPRVVTLPSDLLISGEPERIRDRLALWLDGQVDRHFPMVRAIAEATLEGAARGLAFQVADAADD